MISRRWPSGSFQYTPRPPSWRLMRPEFATEHPDVVALRAEDCLGQTLLQQVQQERRKQLNDLLAHGDVLGLDVPRSRPFIEARTGLVKTLCMPRMSSATSQNGPNLTGAGRPSISARSVADARGSRAWTMVWFSSIVIVWLHD